MPTYLVRIIGNHDLVGVFAADSVMDLMIVIDECTDPGGCEYARLGTGGIMWTSPAIPLPIALPAEIDMEEPEPIPWDRASLTERWWNFFFGYEKCRWKRFFPDEPDPEPDRGEGSEKFGPAHIVPFQKKPHRR